MTPLRLRALHACERTIVSSRGDIDLSTAEVFEEFLAGQVDRGEHTLVINLSHTEYLDSSGLAVLLRVHKRLLDMQGSLSLVGCRPCVLRVLQIVGFQNLFPIEPVRLRRGTLLTA